MDVSKKIYIVEDMAISRAALIEMLQDNGHVVVGSAASADKAWLEIKEMDIDVALLDINLAGTHNGIWLGKKIREQKNMPIIFLTAFGDAKTLEELATIEPNGYLMKPYNIPTLITAIKIAVRSFETSKVALKAAVERTPLIIKHNGASVKIIEEEILFIKSDGNYLELKMQDATYYIRGKLSIFIETLSTGSFQQTHRRYVVNMNAVTIKRPDYLMIGETKIPISKTFKAAINL